MELLSIKLVKKDKGFELSLESDDEEILDYWGARILAFVSGECTCGSCNCVCKNGKVCTCDDDDSYN